MLLLKIIQYTTLAQGSAILKYFIIAFHQKQFKNSYSLSQFKLIMNFLLMLESCKISYDNRKTEFFNQVFNVKSYANLANSDVCNFFSVHQNVMNL